MMMMSPKRLQASVLWSSNASLNAKTLGRIQRNLQLSVSNSLFLPRTSTATITLLHYTVFIHRLYKRDCFNLTQYLWIIFWGMIKRRPCAMDITSFWIPTCMSEVSLRSVSSHCNTVLPPVAIQWPIGLAQMSVSSESKQLQFTRLHTNCSVIVKLFYLLI